MQTPSAGAGEILPATPIGRREEFSCVLREMVEALTSQGRLKKELARACGMRPDYLSHLLGGRRRPTHRDTVVRLAAGLTLNQQAEQRLLWSAGFALDASNDALMPPTVHGEAESSPLVRTPDGGDQPAEAERRSGGQSSTIDSWMWSDGEFRALLSSEQWMALVSLAQRFSFPAGAHLMHQGQRSSYVLVVLSGRVKVVRTSADGSEVLLAIAGPGELLGEMDILDPDYGCSVTVTTLRRSRIGRIATSPFLGFVNEQGLEMALVRHAAIRQRRSDQLRVELATLSVSQRLLRLLSRLALSGQVDMDNGVHVDMDLGQEDLAAALGASRSRVATELAALRRQGIISTERRRIIVHDVPALRYAAGET